MKYTITIILAFFISLTTKAQVVQGELLGTWSDSTLVGSAAFNNTYNEIWGLVSDGVEYAVIGTTLGTHFIDVSNPEEPNEVYVLEGGSTGPVIIHRDYHDQDGYMFAVADEGANSTLQIMDYSALPDSVIVVYDSKEFIRRSHNIFIDTSSSIMYSCISDGDDVNRASLRLFDVSDPTNPEIIDDYNRFGTLTVNQVHDAFVRNDTAYLNCGPHGFAIVDFSDPLAPNTLATLTPNEYVQSGYNHSGWLSENGDFYVMSDEDWDMDLKVLDVSQLPDITLIDTIDGYLYSSYYYQGLQVWDVKNPSDIKRVLHYPTSNIELRRNFEGAWGVYPFLPSGNILVSDMQEGLFVIKGVSETLVSTSEIDPIQDDWTISPNPINSQFEIISALDLADYNISVYNTQGQKIADLDNSGAYKVNWPKGNYVLTLKNKNVLSTKKLILVK